MAKMIKRKNIANLAQSFKICKRDLRLILDILLRIGREGF